MSLPWSSMVKLGFSQDGVALKTSRQPVRMLSSEAVSFNSRDELIQLLQPHAKELKGRSISLILSNALVRFLVMPWNASLVSRDDWNAYAKRAFCQQFGAEAENWQVCVDLHQFGNPVVAVAMHQDMGDTLRDAARLMGFGWRNITPLAIGLFNQINISKHAWTLVAEPEHLLLCVRDAHGAIIDFIVSLPPSGQEAIHSAQLVARYAAQTGQHPKQTHAYVSGKLTGIWREYEDSSNLLTAVYSQSAQTNASWLVQAMI